MGERVNGNGHVTSEERKITDAAKIKVMGSMDVYLQEGSPSIRVEAEDNLIPYILTTNNGDWLEVRAKDHVSFNSHAPMKVFITTPYVDAVTISGSGNVVSDSKVKSNDAITVKIAGSGDVALQLNAPRVDASIVGSGDIKLSGETRDVNVNIAGGGDFKGDGLKAENAKVKITGSGNVTVFADVKLDAKVVGSGDVYYKGNAQVNQSIVGSGTIKRMN